MEVRMDRTTAPAAMPRACFQSMLQMVAPTVRTLRSVWAAVLIALSAVPVQNVRDV
jgi:hypothetical protein